MNTSRIAFMPMVACCILAAAGSAHAALNTVNAVPAGDTLGSFAGVPVPAPVGSLNPSPTPEPSGFTSIINGNTLTFTTSTGGFVVDGNDIGFSNENLNTVPSTPIFPTGYGVLDNSAGPDLTGPITDTITFGTPVTMFGLDVFSLDDAQNFDFTVDTNNLAPVTYSIDKDPGAITDPLYSFEPTTTPDYNPVFFGIQATGGTAITSLTISSPNASASGFVIGAAIPEPAPIALLALGLLPIGLLAVRRRAA